MYNTCCIYSLEGNSYFLNFLQILFRKLHIRMHFYKNQKKDERFESFLVHDTVILKSNSL